MIGIVLAVSAIVLIAARPWLLRRARLVVEDGLGLPHSDLPVSVSVRGVILPFVDFGIPGVPVELGGLRTTTDAEGLCAPVMNVGAAGLHPFQAGISRDSAWRAAPMEGVRVACEPVQPIFICDIDQTISDASHFKATVGRISRIEAIAGSREALERLSERFQIVYLSARDPMMYVKTRAWLRLRGFPAGPLFLRRVRYWTASPQQHKESRLADILSPFSGPKVGVGDQLSDMHAYLASGVTAILFDPKAQTVAPTNVSVARTWSEVEQIALSFPSEQPDRFYAE